MKLGSKPLGQKDTKSILKELKGDIKNKKARLELLKKSRELYSKYK
ncbi:MAG TPA: hypothetical protein VK190_03760 [Pseudoneobacillus sp.]|nr:hypothetical protein [Pseudoneobacillus sp.]